MDQYGCGRHKKPRFRGFRAFQWISLDRLKLLVGGDGVNPIQKCPLFPCRNVPFEWVKFILSGLIHCDPGPLSPWVVRCRFVMGASVLTGLGLVHGLMDAFLVIQRGGRFALGQDLIGQGFALV